jgi:peptide/nickel transport system substrate-binding protein
MALSPTLRLALGAVASILPSAALAQDAPLRIHLNADIRSTDPGVNRDANTDYVMAHIVEGLVGYDDTATVQPMLAETVEVSEDGTVYTFPLRDGVTFHNGAPLTAEDVVLAWERYTDPALGWRCLPAVNGEEGLTVESVEATDPMTVAFTLDRPSALFLSILARADCGQTGIYHRDSLGADGAWVKPIGTGPFTLAEWAPSQYVQLDAFAGYAALPGPRSGLVGDKSPLVPSVRFVIVPDESAARAALLAGDLDVLPDVAYADMAALTATEGIVVDSVPGMGVNGFLFQTNDPLLADPRMRQAIAMALDLPLIAEVATEGTSQASLSVVPPASPYYSEAMAELPAREVEGARALAAEAGYQGQPIKWLATQHYPSLFDTSVLAQAMLAEAGIMIELEVLDWATLLDRYSAGDYQAMAFTYSARLDPALSFDMISGDKAEQPRKVWDNPEAREVLARAMLEADPAARQALFDELEAMFRADMPMVVLYSGAVVSAVRDTVQGYESWSVGSPRAWGVSLSSGG